MTYVAAEITVDQLFRAYNFQGDARSLVEIMVAQGGDLDKALHTFVGDDYLRHQQQGDLDDGMALGDLPS